MKNKAELNIMNCFLCILVILIHVLSESQLSLIVGTPQYIVTHIPYILCTFAVPGFLFLSGAKLIMKFQNNVSCTVFLISRFKKIIIPYLIANLMYLLFFLWAGYMYFDIKYFIVSVFTGRLVAHFYFIVILISFYVLMPFWILVCEKMPSYALLAVSFILMLFSITILPDVLFEFYGIPFYKDTFFINYIFYWIMGCCFGKNYYRLRFFLNEKSKAVWILYCIIAVLYIFTDLKQVLQNKSMPLKDVIRILYSILSILALFTFSVKLRKSTIKKQSFIFSRYTYYIYLYHCLVIYIVNYTMTHIHIMDVGVRLVLRLFSVLLLSVIYVISAFKIRKHSIEIY